MLLLSNAMSGADVELRSRVTKPQPMTGLVLWPDQAADLNETHGASISLEFSYCLPCKVVTGCDPDGTILYDWKWFDDILEDVASRGHQLVARFRYEYPNSKDVDGKTAGMTAVPQYIKDRADYKETYNKVSGDGPTYYADWSNAELKRFTKQFYTDFAARYAADPRLAFVEVGFGHWSEYHIYGTTLQLGKNFPSMEYQKEFLTHMESAMASIPWGISIDAADDSMSPVIDDPSLLALSFGNFDDSFMHKDHEIGSKDGYNEECWRALGSATRWQRGYAGGEISYYTDNDQKNFLNPAGMYGMTWEEQAAKYHISFMIANDAPEGKYGTGERFASAALATGYRFEVRRCTTDGVKTDILVTNTGVAPIYRDAYFAIDGTRSSTSLRGLLPGEEKWISIPCPLAINPDGSAVSNPVIESDHILKTQQIQYDAGPQASHNVSASFMIDGVPVEVTGTYTKTVDFDAPETQYTITVVPVGNATVRDYTGVTPSGSGYIIAAPAPGATSTATFTIAAENGITAVTYTIRIRKNSSPSASDEEVCHFTDNTPSMPDVVTVSGNYARKGTVSYNGIDYSVSVKMESGTSVTITPAYNCKVTLCFTPGSGASKLNGTSFTPDVDGRYTFAATAGETCRLTKDKTNTNLALIIFTRDDMSGIDGVFTGPDSDTTPLYDLMGRIVKSPENGRVVIKNGRKMIYRGN